ncbi:MAG: AMP-binding protein, partial [Lachnospiraceae bacterium]|nr:AMP-binding protein [Lachnospiraceae bacterium]
MRTNALEYLEESARRCPDKVAFADEDSSCTFYELQDRAQRIGTALTAWFPPKKPVPVFMEKSVETIGVFMGALYAGAFYVLVDTKHPAARIAQILDVLQSDVIVTSEKYRKALDKLDFKGTVLMAEELAQSRKDETLLAGIRARALDVDPLYGIFTSGSTGVPKCVVVGHRSLLDFIDCFTDIFGITGQDVIGNQAPWDFDVSVKDIYSGLKTGATVQIIPRPYFSFPTKLLDFLEERQVTTLIWAVSALCIVSTLDGFDYLVPHRINKVLFSGEMMPVK